ncbi:MAG: hypothetical protein ABIF28_06145 [Pseudomonadota bacterium]
MSAIVDKPDVSFPLLAQALRIIAEFLQVRKLSSNRTSLSGKAKRQGIDAE